MAGYDGSVNFDTHIDTKGFNSDANKISDEAEAATGNIGGKFSRMADAIHAAFQNIGAGLQNLGTRASGPIRQALWGAAKSFGDMGANADMAITKIGDKLSKMATAIKSAFGAVGKVAMEALTSAAMSAGGAAIIGLGALLVVVMAVKQMYDELKSSISETSAYYGVIGGLTTAFNNVKGAVMSVYMALLSALTPAIMTVLNWLVQIINTVAQFIAALTGATTYMQYVAGSADSAAKSTGAAAKNTEKQAKAAKGALAAFDQINVLQQKQAEEQPETPAGGGAGGGFGKFVAVPIETEIGNIATKVRYAFDLISAAWTTLQEAWIIAGHTLQDIWGIVSTAAIIAWTTIKQAAIDAWTWIQTTWATASAWFLENIIIPLSSFFSTLWTGIQTDASTAWLWIQTTWATVATWFTDNVVNPLKNKFSEAWDAIKGFAINAWVDITSYWATFSSWFTDNVTNPLKTAFYQALNAIKDKFGTIFDSIAAIIKGTLNGIIRNLNNLIANIVNSINRLIDSVNTIRLPGVPILSHVAAPQIPYLARGAVIPPNAAFAAVLGDQHNGRNLEGPEDLFRQIVRDEMQNTPQRVETTIKFAGNMATLVQALKPYIDQENTRIGPSFVVSSGN